MRNMNMFVFSKISMHEQVFMKVWSDDHYKDFKIKCYVFHNRQLAYLDSIRSMNNLFFSLHNQKNEAMAFSYLAQKDILPN